MLTEKELILKRLFDIKGFRVDDVTEHEEFGDVRMVVLGFSTISTISAANDISYRVMCKTVSGTEERECLTHYDLVVPVIIGWEAITTEATKTHVKFVSVADILEEIDTGTEESVKLRRKEAIKDMANVGFSGKEIIEAVANTGISKSTVRRLIKEIETEGGDYDGKEEESRVG